MEILLVIAVFHVAPVGIAMWCAFKRSPRFHVPAILVLMSDLVGFSMAQGLLPDRYPPPVAQWMLAGPLFLPMQLMEAMIRASLWVAPLIVAGVAIGMGVWRWLWQRTKWRAWALAAVLAGSLGAWAISEVAVEAAMRIQAGKISNACIIDRLPTPFMLTAALSDPVWKSWHAEVRNGTSVYRWSFGKSDWYLRRTCAVDQPSACSCPGKR